MVKDMYVKNNIKLQKISIIKEVSIFIKKYLENSTGIRKNSINKHPLKGGGSNAPIQSWLGLSLAT